MRKLRKYCPPGINPARELGCIAAGYSVAMLMALSFFFRYAECYNQLFHYMNQRRTEVLIEGAVIEEFSAILSFRLAGFIVLAVSMLLLIAFHYAYHYQGSKSIYLMRRLPKRSELHKRCMVIPISVFVLTVLTAICLLFFFHHVYMTYTPAQCLPPGQWNNPGIF